MGPCRRFIRADLPLSLAVLACLIGAQGLAVAAEPVRVYSRRPADSCAATGSCVIVGSHATLAGYDYRCHDCEPYNPPSEEELPSPAEPAASPYEEMEPEPADFQPQQFAALGSQTWSVNSDPAGYIDNPIVGNWLRLRYDNANDGQRPDRAEFIYARYAAGDGTGGPGPGPPNSSVLTPSRLDYELFSTYAELLFFPRLSGFLELTAKRVDIDNPGIGSLPNVVTSNAGLGDTIAGIKYALLVDNCRYLTFQFKTYIPTGDSSLGLGTRHVSLEPGFLYLGRLSCRSYFMGELRQWIPVDGTNFAGPVLSYGAGVGYDLYRRCAGCSGGASPLNPYVSDGGMRLTGVAEFVGWNILGGRYTPGNQNSDSPPSVSADGNGVFSLKLGLRGTVGCRSLYVGWGHALTGAPWYEDLLRLEYRRLF